ncbi:hypothetical protein T440DRAFT_518215 [Plenodomus tracheiphilus IPT5]|uniref:Uncharacterized protein n=1 Tax=Plenodomus tracheiphilus IPT5 TaxID=1408161 RepID=A0A6A7B886_9PLEO|nr:hypothetical protein T440DRAFT_518215 [Plenodomus tracheiphilus IPT5]
MLLLYSTLLYAATTSAQLTTSLLIPLGDFGTQKVGFVASILDANSTHTTLALSYDNGTDWSALSIPQTPTPATITIGPPNKYEGSDNLAYLARGIRTVGGDYAYSIRCDMPQVSASTINANASCIASYGPLAGSTIQCIVGTSYTSTEYATLNHTYPPRGTVSGGVETFTRTMLFPAPREERPGWCGDEAYSPAEGYTTRFEVEPTYLAVLQVVVTAGEEKLTQWRRIFHVGMINDKCLQDEFVGFLGMGGMWVVERGSFMATEV